MSCAENMNTSTSMMIMEKEKKLGDGAAWKRGAMLGKGSFGTVYLATLKNPKSKYGYLPEVMAVKSAEVSASGSIQKERQVLQNVKGCPNVIQCFGEEPTIGDNGEMVYNLLLEYGSGGTLAEKIAGFGGKGLPEFEVKCYAKSILRGLSFIHHAGYVHCDLKPDNILLVPRNCGSDDDESEFRAKIGDFGLAKRAPKECSKKRKLEPYWRGTPMYLAPECVEDGVQDSPSDVWALGCIVLEMLTGKSPWDVGEEVDADEIMKRIGKELPHVPGYLSKEAREFLKGCFVRKSMFRLTAEMLLNHTFLEGLAEVDDDDAAFAATEVIEDISVIGTIFMVSESDDDYVSDEDIFGSEDCSVSYLSYEEDDAGEEEDEVVSHCRDRKKLRIGESEGVGVMSSTNVEAGFERPIQSPKLQAPAKATQAAQLYPVSFRIPAGV